MKLRITEEQLKAIEDYMTEAKKIGDKKVQEKLGGFIENIYDNIRENQNTEFKLASGNKLVLKCVAEKNNVYFFQLVVDSAKIFDKWETISLTIKTGNGDDNLLNYKMNEKVISSQDNGNTFSLIFNVQSKSGIKTTKKLDKINDVILDGTNQEPEQPEEPQQQPKPETTPKKPEETYDDEELKQDGEEALKYILSNEMLKNAFYEQPSFWQLFVAELTGKKTKGKGIIAVANLVKDYDDKQINEKLGGRFIENGVVYFIPLDTVNLPVNGVDLTFDKYIKNGYRTTVLPREINKNFKLKGKLDNIDYNIEIVRRLKNRDFEYNCVLTPVNQVKDENIQKEIRIKILKDKSQGFEVINKK